MILRRFGSSYEAVEPAFNATALTEISFRRSGGESYGKDEFAERFERVDEREIGAETEGDVKNQVEEALLQAILAQLRELEAEVGPDAVLVFENMPGQDYPKTVDVTRTRVVAGENRLHFTYRVEPPLRLGVYRRRG